MVAITNNAFGRYPTTNSSASDIPTRQSGPVTPTASDCLSISSDSDALDSSVVPVLAPVRRDPSLIIERLENCIGRRRMGKRKMRRALNDAALAALVEGYEEVPSLVMRPYHSAFQQLLESPTNMMVWYHFANLSEEDQRLYLAGPRQRAHVIEASLAEDLASRPVRAASQPASGAVAAVDRRSFHPAALPHSTTWGTHGLIREDSVPILLEPLLGVGGHQHPFSPPKLHSSVPTDQGRSRSATADASRAATTSTEETAAFSAESATPLLTTSEPQPLDGGPPPAEREFCRTVSPARGTAAMFHCDADPLCTGSDVSLLDGSQSSSSFEVLEESDTDHDSEEFLLLGQ